MLTGCERVVEGLRALFPAPAWAKGATPLGDAEFLLRMVDAHSPTTMVEIGVAAGVSSSVLLYALDALPAATPRRLYSCDIQPECYFDARYATGQAAHTMYPRPRAEWLLDTNMDARRLAGQLAPGSVDLTFIDANHFHPWPLLDLLHMTAVVRAGSWVVLHDINLPAIAPAYAAWGAKWLFDAWPFEKVSANGARSNIGAVRLPDDLMDVTPVARELLDRAWEFEPTLWHVKLPHPFDELQALVERRIRRSA